MIDLDMDAARPLDLSLAPLDMITVVMRNLCDKDRFTCALVCKAWAKAAAAATSDVIIWKPTLQRFNCFQQWLEKHGNQLVVLKLRGCGGAALIALPCAQLQDLVLQGDFDFGADDHINIDSRVWGDIAASTNLTAVVLSGVKTASQQADVVSALTALRGLKQLTWYNVWCSGEQQLSDSLLLQHLTKLTALDVHPVSAGALDHLGSLTKLQYLSIIAKKGSAAAGCPGLGELKALTRLQLDGVEDIPAPVCQLTALQELHMWKATPTALSSLQALTGLTQLHVRQLEGLSLHTPPLQLPGLQHLLLSTWGAWGSMPLSFLASCTQLHHLKLWTINLSGPGSLVVSTMLQHLALSQFSLGAAAGVAGGPVSWQQVFPGPGRMPRLTSLQLSKVQPDLQQGDMEHVVACCSSLRALQLTTMQDSFASALAQLSGLTRPELEEAGDEQCGALAQLTGLRELTVDSSRVVSAAGLRQLAALEQLTSLGFIDILYPSKMCDVLLQHTSDTLGDCAFAIVNQVCVVRKASSSTLQ